MQTDYIHTHTDTPSWITDVCVCVYVCVCDMSSPLTWGGSDSLQADSCWTCTYNINTHTHTHTLFCVIISLALFSYNAHTHSWRVIIIIRSLNGGLKKKCFWNTSDIKKSVCITDCPGLKPMWKRLQAAFCLMASRGRLQWFQEEVKLYVSLWENDPTSADIRFVDYGQQGLL